MTVAAVTLISAEMRDCIDNCLGCHATCEATLSYCLARDGALADRNRMLILLDCAEICQTSAGFLLRGSGLHANTCAACAAICTSCAAWCDQRQRDGVMQQCAATCRECAESCDAMAKMH